MIGKRLELGVALLLCACAAPPGPTGPEKAADYQAEQEKKAVEARNPKPPSEEEMTLQFPMCKVERRPLFSQASEGAAFRAIVSYRITEDGKTAEHCYLRVDGAIKWEERALGNVQEWTYPVKFSGQPRERTVSYRLK